MTGVGTRDRPIPEYLATTGRPTGWYSIKRLRPEGGYADVTFDGQEPQFLVEQGPLRGTRVGSTPVWCAVSEGKLSVAPRTNDDPPPPYGDALRVRGSYAPNETGVIEWQPIGEPWDDDEIDEHRVLSNLAYELYARVPIAPQHVLYFGAGASYGSDHRQRAQARELPPLGNKLFHALHTDQELTYWPRLPDDVADLFNTPDGFEAGMLALEQIKDLEPEAWDRDLELALYFSRFRPSARNLYWRLARRAALRMANGWTGAAVTLNYDRLLEESFMRNWLFTPVKGVTWYDERDQRMPTLRGDQLFEIAYPHGACQFWLGQSFIELKNGGKVVWGSTARIEGNVGAHHLLNRGNIPLMCERYQLPLICRYEPSKRASVGSYFIDGQRMRARDLVLNAARVSLVGVRCTFPGDMQVWGPLGETDAQILYVEPDKDSRESFRSKWAAHYGKTEGKHFRILDRTFDGAFEAISRFNRL